MKKRSARERGEHGWPSRSPARRGLDPEAKSPKPPPYSPGWHSQKQKQKQKQSKKEACNDRLALGGCCYYGWCLLKEEKMAREGRRQEGEEGPSTAEEGSPLLPFLEKDTEREREREVEKGEWKN